MTSSTSKIITLNAALKHWSLSKTSYYARINPALPTYDAECPVAWPTGTAPNSPRALTQTEVDTYADLIAERGRAALAADTGASRDRAQLMIAARRARVAGLTEA